MATLSTPALLPSHWMTTHTEILIKGGLSVLALVVVIIRHRRPGKLSSEQAGQMLIAMAVIAVLAYCNFGKFHANGLVHHWEQFHYFLGSKYFPELRYDGLYIASLTAEREIDLGHGVQDHIRDLRTNEVVNIGGLSVHAYEVKSRFTSARWRSFVSDNAHFLHSNNYDYIMKIRTDHGYNPTPTWTFTARLFTSRIPAQLSTLEGLALIDPILLVIMFVMILKTYGSRIGCLSLIVFGLGYPWRFDWVGGALLRQDWLASIGIAICLQKREKNLFAGVLIAYATMVRVFPGGFLIGAAIFGIKSLMSKQPPRATIALALGFVLGAGIGLGAGCLTGAGPEAWTEFGANLSKHHDTWLTNNVGLKNTILYDSATYTRRDVRWNLSEPWILWQSRMNERQAMLRPLLVMASGLYLLIIAAAAWQMPQDEASTLGIGVAFAAVVLTCYYWVMLLLIPMGRGRWGPVATVLALNSGLYALHLMTPSFEVIYGVFSWMLAIGILIWAAPDALKSWRQFKGWVKTRG